VSDEQLCDWEVVQRWARRMERFTEIAGYEWGQGTGAIVLDFDGDEQCDITVKIGSHDYDSGWDFGGIPAPVLTMTTEAEVRAFIQAKKERERLAYEEKVRAQQVEMEVREHRAYLRLKEKYEGGKDE
jgi:hypothetical protein